MFYKLNKRQFISRWNYDTLPCVELIEVEGHECPCIPPIGCTILRTKEKLPKPISNISKHIIDSVTSIDGSVIFDETTWRGKNWRNGDKYTSKKPDYFIKDDYMYFTVTRTLRYVTIIGLFNDPLEVENFPSVCDEQECEDCNPCENNTSFMEVEFNIDDDLIDTLIEMSVKELVVMFNQSREDLSNDSKDNIQQESK